MGTVPPKWDGLWLTLRQPAGLIETKPPEQNGGGNALAGDCPQPRVWKNASATDFLTAQQHWAVLAGCPHCVKPCDGRRDTLPPRSVCDSRGASKMRMKLPGFSLR